MVIYYNEIHYSKKYFSGHSCHSHEAGKPLTGAGSLR